MAGGAPAHPATEDTRLTLAAAHRRGRDRVARLPVSRTPRPERAPAAHPRSEATRRAAIGSCFSAAARRPVSSSRRRSPRPSRPGRSEAAWPSGRASGASCRAGSGRRRRSRPAARPQRRQQSERWRPLARIIPEARYSGSTGRGGTTNRVSPSSFGGCEGVAGRAMGRWPGAVSPSVDSFSWRRSVSSPRELGAAGRMGYPARAPSARAMRCHASRCGVARGRCRTSQRTERTTWTPSLSNRSRSHVTWVRAHAVPAARSLRTAEQK